jgi:hypothetical protein
LLGGALAGGMQPPEQQVGESPEQYQARVAEFQKQYQSNLAGTTGAVFLQVQTILFILIINMLLMVEELVIKKVEWVMLLHKLHKKHFLVNHKCL